METSDNKQSPEAQVPDEDRASIFNSIKKWAGIIWHVPGVKNVALSAAAKLLIRVGLPAGLGVLVIGIAEAIGSNI